MPDEEAPKGGGRDDEESGGEEPQDPERPEGQGRPRGYLSAALEEIADIFLQEPPLIEDKEGSEGSESL